MAKQKWHCEDGSVHETEFEALKKDGILSIEKRVDALFENRGYRDMFVQDFREALVRFAPEIKRILNEDLVEDPIEDIVVE